MHTAKSVTLPYCCIPCPRHYSIMEKVGTTCTTYMYMYMCTKAGESCNRLHIINISKLCVALNLVFFVAAMQNCV